MAGVANNIQKILRHHVPMIRFKYGVNHSDSTNHAPKENKSESNTAKTSGATTSSQSKISQKSGSLEFSQIPNKYRRRQLTQEEIDLVTIGGST
ncbi:unnamed protein product [Adineta steineri]|uniref:28S ribosomal protein S36, mitochondrial n=1 Tax=Adineta steineri TaxID=433720 RepID=A0A813V3W6_9BILA|nr:unnamed protein product [Adineta steineri]CAF1122235.1 unnamed protein product [Adineta steineri]CAF1160858.1 unnamed protein product [Adineta steineri]CAF1253490.1 unnamed protein product [Adineta steineri]CAF1309878.1 unnamed protein product [Adineta steineri]